MNMRAMAFGALAVLALAGFSKSVDSGLKVGETVFSFNPHHVTGPLKGTDSCPPCTYGNRPMVQAWVNGPDEGTITALAKTLDADMAAHADKQLKTFVIVLVNKDQVPATESLLTSIAKKTGCNQVALAYLSKDDEAVSDYEVNTAPEVKSTIFVYKNRTVDTKFVNLATDDKGLAKLDSAVVAMIQK